MLGTFIFHCLYLPQRQLKICNKLQCEAMCLLYAESVFRAACLYDSLTQTSKGSKVCHILVSNDKEVGACSMHTYLLLSGVKSMQLNLLHKPCIYI